MQLYLLLDLFLPVPYLCTSVMFVFSFIANEVHPSCVEMNYYEQYGNDYHFINFYFGGDYYDYMEYYQDCFAMGGRLLYQRQMTHYGHCYAKMPCFVTSSENVLIYENVCV